MNTPPDEIATALPHRRHIVSLMTIALGHAAIGVALWLQPERWFNTPSYANLLSVASTEVWGSVYLAVSAVMLLAVWRRRNRFLVVTAHTAGIALVGSWLIAFFVRYLTDDGTTIVNVVSWATFLAILARSAIIIDDDLGTEQVPAGESNE